MKKILLMLLLPGGLLVALFYLLMTDKGKRMLLTQRIMWKFGHKFPTKISRDAMRFELSKLTYEQLREVYAVGEISAP